MTLSRTLKLATLALACGAARTMAQDSVVAKVTPCRAYTCSIIFDWGNGTSGAGLPSDRRYGAPAEFESTVRQTLRDLGFNVLDSETGGKLALAFRLRQMSAICDVMPGTNTDRKCQTVRDVGVTFVSTDPELKKPGAMNLANRCSAGDQAMTNPQFGRYVALQLQFAFEGGDKHLPRPSAKC